MEKQLTIEDEKPSKRPKFKIQKNQVGVFTFCCTFNTQYLLIRKSNFMIYDLPSTDSLDKGFVDSDF